MRKVKEYIVVSAPPDEISARVMEKIRSGFQPYGNLVSSGSHCVQPLVKYTELDEPAPGPVPPITGFVENPATHIL